MLFVAGTFIGVVVLVIGIYWLMFERPETREQGKLRKRLRAAAGTEGRPSESTSSRRPRS